VPGNNDTINLRLKITLYISIYCFYIIISILSYYDYLVATCLPCCNVSERYNRVLINNIYLYYCIILVKIWDWFYPKYNFSPVSTEITGFEIVTQKFQRSITIRKKYYYTLCYVLFLLLLLYYNITQNV